MSGFIDRLKTLWQHAIRLWRREPQPALPAAAPEEAAPEVQVQPPRMNRHARRAYERARRRHDRFVKRQEVLPVKQERPAPAVGKPKAKKEELLPTIDDPNDPVIAGEWLEGDGEQVLYEESEFYGEFNFRDTILDQLDRYWFYLERMRKHDTQAYAFYKQLGATLVPYAATGSWSDKPKKIGRVVDLEGYKRGISLSPWFKQNWPAFGCIAMGANPREEKRETVKLDGKYQSSPKFMYFRRVVQMPWKVQPVRSGKLYMLTVWWDRKDDYKWGRPQEFPIHISDDGSCIRALKTRQSSNGDVRQWWDWQYPHDNKVWARQHGLDAATHIARTFCDAARDIERASYSMLRIEVSKGDLTAVFGLSPKRTSYFFQDRDIVLTEDGVKKRVFHIVRPHVRKDGTPVPIHFRGLREFTWAGYRVWISVPGRDHADLNATGFPGIVYSNSHIYKTLKKKEDLVNEERLAAVLKREVHGHYGQH